MSAEFRRKWRVALLLPQTTSLFDLSANGGIRNTSEQLSTDALRIQFKATKTLGKEPNTLDLYVWNLAEESRAKLKEARMGCVLEAGYEGQIAGAATIFSGTTRTIDHLRDHADWKTHVQCGDGEREYQFSFVNQNFGARQSFNDVVKSVANSLGVKLGNLDQALAAAPKKINQFVKGFVAHGRSSDVLSTLLKSAGLDWTIHQGSLLVVAPGQAASNEVFKLTPTTGLIGSPDHTPPDQKGKPATLKCRCLLNPQIRPASIVEIESAGVKGQFVVQKLEHKGDSHGQEWTTEIEAWAKS